MNINLTSLLDKSDNFEFRSINKITFKVDEPEPRKSDNIFTTTLESCVTLKINDESELSKLKPMTLHTVFHNAVENGKNDVAMKYKYSQDSDYLAVTYSEFYQLCCLAGKSLIKLGLNPRNSVCIAGHNAPPWHISYFGAIFAGGVSSGVYVTNTEDTVQFILNNCNCQIAIVGSLEILKRYMKVSNLISSLKAIVQYYGETDTQLKKESVLPIYDWAEFINFGKDLGDLELKNRIESLVPNECCSLIYTSGTTGNPKGVMMSHDNLIWTARCLHGYIKFRDGKEILISYLPLSHVAAQMCDIIIPILCRAVIYFAQPDALKGSLGVTLKEVHPTYFIGVPRVFEKIMEQMKEIAITMSSMKQSMSAWAKDIGLRTNLAKMNKESGPFGYAIAKCLIFNKVHKALGFDRCLGAFSAAAPLSKDVIRYFASLDIIICEIYGMSECSGPETIEFHKNFYIGSVGKVLPEFKLKLHNKDARGEGEICMFGRHVFMGYLKEEEKTKDVFDADNWLHSGDIGVINDEGFLFITGRIKELLITAGGENIAPVPIEEKMKENLPFVSNVMVVGEKRKYLVVLLTIKCIFNVESQSPTDELTPMAIRWCHSIGYDPKSIHAMVAEKDSRVVQAVEEAIKITNKSAISGTACIQKWAFLPYDFSIPGGELGPTMKVKRNVVVENFHNIIDQLYES